MNRARVQTKLIHFDGLGVLGAWHDQAAELTGLGGEVGQREVVGEIAPIAAKKDSAVSNQAPDGLLGAGAGRRPRIRTMRRKFVSMLFAIFSLMLLADAASAITPAGTVDAVSGSCTAHGRVLKRGDVVQVSDTVEVPAGGKLKLRMADGSLISIAADSSMTVASYDIGSAGRHAKLSLTRGLLRAVVVAVGGPSTFEVSTAVGTASVRSADADWFIESQPGSARVGVEAGTIELTSATTGRSAKIPANWGGSQMAGLEPALPRPWPRDELDEFMARTK
jgi:FecR protein